MHARKALVLELGEYEANSITDGKPIPLLIRIRRLSVPSESSSGHYCNKLFNPGTVN